MDVKCTINDFLAEKMSKVGEVKLESVPTHGDKVRLTSGNGVSCIVNISDLISAAERCRIDIGKDEKWMMG